MISPFGTDLKQVGEIAPPRQEITGRLPKNPTDKCTVVSIYPHKVIENKLTIDPGRFTIEPGSFENPSLLIVGSSSYWLNRQDDMPALEVPVFSINVANSIVLDYCNGLFACDMVDRMPGLFYVEGAKSLKEIKTDYAQALETANIKQRAWFKELVKIADSIWARSNNNPMSIGDDMRLAAQELSLKDKPWMMDFKTYEMVPCFACGSLKNPLYPVCMTCKAIDKTNPAAASIQFTGA